MSCREELRRMADAGPVLLGLVLLLALRLAAAVPLEVYGRLPGLEDVSLSPNGSRIAFVRTTGDTRVIAVVSLADQKVLGGLRLGEQKLRHLSWADDDRLMVMTSETSTPWGIRGSHEWRQLQVFDVVSHKTRFIPSDWGPYYSIKPNTMNVISGPVMVRRVGGHTVLFVHGYEAGGVFLSPILISNDLDNDRQRVVRQGSNESWGWLVDDDGKVIAEEIYKEATHRWSLRILLDDRMKEAVAIEQGIDVPKLLGFGPKEGSVLLQFIEDGSPVWKLLSLKDGTLGPSMPERRALDQPIEDRASHRMIGGVVMKDSAAYVFFDPKRQAEWNAIVRAFHGDRVLFVSASTDFRKVVVRVDGPNHGYAYQLVDLNSGKADPLGDVYEGVTKPLEVRRITYEAGDGLRIPAYLTLPRGHELVRLPLVVLPHGGPEARDTADFDWFAQALADQGYAVLQPNFRGSSLDAGFIAAGFGEIGRKMQTDLSDGVRYLVNEGTVDPARVCIVGASYGGYAALAGVSLESGVYRCAASVSGLADLRKFLIWQKQMALGSGSLGQRFWDRFLGVSGPDDPTLVAISPIHHVDAIKVPILLIHGQDDTVVPFDQSNDMYEAMLRAKKNVAMEKLTREDHWMSRSETRLQMLRSVVAFLRAHNPPD